MWEPDVRVYLLPWTALLAVAAAVPIWMEVRRRDGFNLYHPLVFVSWSHIVPAYVLGGLALVNGWRPWFFHLIPGPDRTLPLTMFYAAIGFLALALGFALPIGRRLGAHLAPRLPRWDWQPREVIPPALALLAVAGTLNAAAFRQGLLGYQATDAVGAFDAALAIAAWAISTTATVLLWLAVFQTRPLTRGVALLAAMLVAWALAEVIVSGRRGALVQSALLAGGAFWLSGRRIRAVHGAVLALAGALAIGVGVAYGTTFRQLKGSEERIAFGEYVQLSRRAAEATFNRGLAGNAAFVFRHLTERLEIITTVAVVVANYERLEPFEREFGLSGNIVSGVTTSLIPRFVWPAKPAVLDPRALGELYFGLRNSFAITPVGDLVRNFGPWSIPIGMGLIGVALGVLYGALIEGRRPAIWRSAAYLVLLTSVSFEAFYGSILPSVLRAGAVLTACLVIVAATRPTRFRLPGLLPGGTPARRT
jgi:hypothetical protein